MRAFSFFIFLIYLFLNPTDSSGQYIKGKVLDESNSSSLGNQEILVNGKAFVTDQSGKFLIYNDFSEDEIVLTIINNDYKDYKLSIANPKSDIELGIIFLENNETENQGRASSQSYTVNRDYVDNYDFDEEVSGLLSAAWDPFGSVAGYNFGVTRYNPRGMAQNHSLIYLNTIPFNNLGDGRYFWSLWGGLNDAFRSSYSEHGLNSTDYSIGGFGGMEDIDLRATNQRAGTRLSVDHSNRSYLYRTMLSHNSGVQDNGWSYAFTVSRRWGNGGYVKGTYYDGYGYYGSVDKRINDKHSLNLLVFASPTTRGRPGASTQQVYDLVGNGPEDPDNFYNPNWGFQNGKIRNSREYRTHQPVFMLRHDFTLSDNTSITTSAALQTGKFGSTRLAWLEAADPRPDYYGNLPYDNRDVLSPADLERLTSIYDDEAGRQLNWDEFYQINRERQYDVVDNDNPGSTRKENISAYILEEQRYDNRKMVLNTNIIHQLSSNSSLKSGFTFQYDRNHNFKIVDDLLGGSHYLDVDGFALRESVDNDFIQNDLARPNRLLSEGDIYGYDYYKHIQNVNAWSTYSIALPKVDINISGMVANTRFWREGLVENGKFPGEGEGLKSLGNSETVSFLHGTAKLGMVYKINGRNYVYGNGAFMTRAPFSRNAFESADTRNNFVPDLQTEKILGGELGYILRHPKLNARVTGFYSRSKDEIKSSKFFLVNVENSISAFGNLLTSGIETVNYGVELGIDYKLTSTFSLKLASALGEYYYDSNQQTAFTIDNSGQSTNFESLETAYMDGFNLGGVPQVASSFELRYDSPNFWFATLSLSHFDDIYIDANPIRRTAAVSQAVLNITETKGYNGPNKEETLTSIVRQEKYDSFFKLDLYARKSFRWNKSRDYRLAVYVSVENLLNDTNNRIGGYEQLRFDYVGLDPDRWGSRYYYAYGTLYRIGATFSI